MAKRGNPRGQSIVARERRFQAVELAKRGYSYRQIASALNVSVKTAHLDVKRGLVELAPLTGEEAVQFRALMIERLNLWLQKLAPRIEGGDLSALDRALKINKQIMDLTGIAAPNRLEITTDWRTMALKDGINPDEFKRQLTQVYIAQLNVGSAGSDGGAGGSPQAGDASAELPAPADGIAIEGVFVEPSGREDTGPADMPAPHESVEGIL